MSQIVIKAKVYKQVREEPVAGEVPAILPVVEDEEIITFNPPYKEGDRGQQVFIIKKFLSDVVSNSNLNVESSNDKFDIKMRRALEKYQKSNMRKIFDIAGWTDVSAFEQPLADRDRGPNRQHIPGTPPGPAPEYINSTNNNTEVSVYSDTDPRWEAELGRVGYPTLLVMAGYSEVEGPVQYETWVKGNLLKSAQDVYNKMGVVEESGLSSDAVENILAPEPYVDPNPYIVGSDYVVVYKTDHASIVSVPTSVDPNNDARTETYYKLVSEALKKLFKFYGKSFSWTIDVRNNENSDRLDFPKHRDAFPLLSQQVNQFNSSYEATMPMDLTIEFGGNIYAPRFFDGTNGIDKFITSVRAFTPQNERPGDVVRLEVRVPIKMVETAAPDQSIFDKIDKVLETAEEIYNKAKPIYDAAEKFVNASAEERDKMIGAAASAAKRQLEKTGEELKNNAWSYLKEQSAQKALDRAKFGAIKNNEEIAAQRAKDLIALPDLTQYETRTFRNKVTAVVKQMREYAKDVEKWSNNQNGAFEPKIDLNTEATFLEQILVSMNEILQVNGFSMRTDRFDDFISIFFNPVNRDGQTIGLEVINIGFEGAGGFDGDKEINVGKDATELSSGPVYFNRGLEILQKSPFNNPRTMGYLYYLDKMYNDVLVKDACENGEGIAAVNFISKYTFPVPTVKMDYDRHKKSTLKTNINIFGPIKDSTQNLTEGLASLSDLFKSEMWSVSAGKSFSLTDKMNFGDLCTLEELYNEILNKYDLKQLLCEYWNCIPDLPLPINFNWDFNFTLPSLPRFPIFDLMAIIVPLIELNIVELIVKFLCGLVRKIIDKFSYPSCDEFFGMLLDFGKAQLSNLVDDEDEVQGNISDDGKIVSKTLRDYGLGTEYKEAVNKIFEKISMVLTPAELCGLLEGEPIGNTLAIVKDIILKDESNFKDYVYTEAQITGFFKNLGTLLGPQVCDRLRELPPVRDSSLCQTAADIRRSYDSGKGIINEEDFNKMMEDRMKAAGYMTELANGNPLESLVVSPVAQNGTNPLLTDPTMAYAVRRSVLAIFDIAKRIYEDVSNNIVYGWTRFDITTKKKYEEISSIEDSEEATRAVVTDFLNGSVDETAVQTVAEDYVNSLISNREEDISIAKSTYIPYQIEEELTGEIIKYKDYALSLDVDIFSVNNTNNFIDYTEFENDKEAYTFRVFDDELSGGKYEYKFCSYNACGTGQKDKTIRHSYLNDYVDAYVAKLNRFYNSNDALAVVSKALYKSFNFYSFLGTINQLKGNKKAFYSYEKMDNILAGRTEILPKAGTEDFCSTKHKKILDFEKTAEETTNNFNALMMEENNNPEKRNWSNIGPMEKAIADSAMKTWMFLSVFEIIVPMLPAMSILGFSAIKDSIPFREYVLRVFKARNKKEKVFEEITNIYGSVDMIYPVVLQKVYERLMEVFSCKKYHYRSYLNSLSLYEDEIPENTENGLYLQRFIRTKGSQQITSVDNFEDILDFYKNNKKLDGLEYCLRIVYYDKSINHRNLNIVRKEKLKNIIPMVEESLKGTDFFDSEGCRLTFNILAKLKNKLVIGTNECFFTNVLNIDKFNSIILVYYSNLMKAKGVKKDIFIGVKRSLENIMKNALSKLAYGTTDYNTQNSDLFTAMNDNMSTSGPNLGEEIMKEFGDLQDQLWEMAKMAIPTMVRGIAHGIDPAYRHMKELHTCTEKGPRFSDGLTLSSIAYKDGYKRASTDASDSKYRPINFSLPVDVFANSTKPFTLVEILQAARNGSYGKLLTPFGLAGLSMPQLKGEENRKLIEQCPWRQKGIEEKDIPECEWEDEECLD